MIGICVVTHGNFAEGIKNSLEMITGQVENLEILSLYEGQVMEKFQDQAFEVIKRLDQGEGVLVFTDMLGATPFNTVAHIRNKLIEEKIKCGVITGLNLPMLIESTIMRGSLNLADLLISMENTGKDSISTLDVSLSV
ncbi:PTS sugar transporter subunit IIA [Enterococcus avium]|uniref:PTS sugar transporter subunit IIA n=1 Tax=Enterococcus avium TaxID=33945 RepID=UPI002891DA3F|nr:PTS sugar transporter subunit IIA [Enterococcus avium]MDT2485070.1 PTS sugar transporter subunit IIA [Enterococcus avium]MDT2511428.1 PTS sugar transporter subunit IIA [Enterococcus avium]